MSADVTFHNEPTLEFRRESVRAQALRALAELRDKLPLTIASTGGRAGELVSTNPANPAEVIAIAPEASSADANNAVAMAAAAFGEWSRRGSDERAAVLQRAAGFMRERRQELAALTVLEAGKPWPEADADVCEAIDFLEYYAAGVLALEQGRPLVQLPGERNTLHYFARGVCAVIAPWNFPLAIPTGMIAAALGTGNTVVFKPAEQTPACGHAIVEALHAAGVPVDALQLLCGRDEPAKALVAHARVHTIAFTGSCAAGLSIIRAAAEPAAGQHHVKRVIAEMGGKNCIIVDADADLDDAVPAIVNSAFGFAGQKCSAASRVLVDHAIADELNERLAGAVATLRVGPAEDFTSDLSVVIDEDALARIGSYLDGAPLPPRATAPIPGGCGHYVKPTLFVDLPSDSRIVNDEVFGPVLSSERVAGVEAALEIVEAGPYGLTGGLFSRSPRTIDLVTRRGIVGNLYVNREITGAMVGRQPFGGGRLSGTGPKAGGPDYLLQFVEARSVSENTVRHGLVV
ncbi:MAG TPA: aldehyde dehydrogenase family protein [Solirubrobacteraceae bacterium]|jgi:RHH-type proline utilization regulon transcriptional repressor/proline dehydrogenase/delta 1-pyrroline-5-carboxylate dehydrogenase|nr:aldehyde dehydrogenase family protein [Solirubrobacteraceae bacterium]